MNNIYMAPQYQIQAVKNGYVPIGTITVTMSDDILPDHLLLQGQILSKDGHFSDLYEVIGDSYARTIDNPERKWFQFWKPKKVTEQLDNNTFRLPDMQEKTT